MSDRYVDLGKHESRDARDQRLRCPECETTAFTVTQLARLGPTETVRIRCDRCGGIVADAGLQERHPMIDAQLQTDGGAAVWKSHATTDDRIPEKVHEATAELARELQADMKAEAPTMYAAGSDDPVEVDDGSDDTESPFDLAAADADRYRALIEDRIRQFHAKADKARSRGNPERQRAYRDAAESLEVAL